MMNDNNKKRLAIRLAIIFIGVMLLFTFFSRSIFYYLTPKVTTDDIESGFIKQELTATNAGYFAPGAISIQPPKNMIIRVQDVLVSPGEKVSEGDMLFTMTDVEIDNIIKELTKEISDANTALLEFQQKYNVEIARLSNEIPLLTLAYEKAKSSYEFAIEEEYSKATIRKRKITMEDAKYKLDRAQGELDYIQDTGIVSGKTIESVEKDVSYLERFLSMLVPGKGIASDGDYIIGLIYEQPDGGYTNSNVMLTLLPEESQLSILLELNGLEIKDGELPQCTISWSKDELEGTITDTMAWGSIEYFRIQPANMAQPIVFDSLNDSEKVKCNIVSQFYNTIIPNSSLVSENKVYILKPKSSIWGEVYALEETKIATGETNGYKTAVLDGLSRLDMLVIGWDRAIKDGDTVMLPIR